MRWKTIPNLLIVLAACGAPSGKAGRDTDAEVGSDTETTLVDAGISDVTFPTGDSDCIVDTGSHDETNPAQDTDPDSGVTDIVAEFITPHTDISCTATTDAGAWENVTASPPYSPYTFDNTDAPVLGNPDNPAIEVTLFSDFGCPHCRDYAPTFAELAAVPAYAARVAFYHRNYILHPLARIFHQAARAAHLQGAFWPMHDWSFANYGAATEEDIFAAAENLGLDMTRFESDYTSEETQELLNNDKREGLAALGTNEGVPCSGMGTPSVFVGGVKIAPRTNVTAVLNCILTAIPKESD